MSDQYTPVTCTPVRQSAKAVLMKTEMQTEIWVPMSQIFEDDLAELEIGVVSEINIATWFVQKEF